MSQKESRKNMEIGTYPRHVLLRMQPSDFYRLHQRAAENNRSLNFEVNSIVREALSGEKTKAATIS